MSTNLSAYQQALQGGADEDGNVVTLPSHFTAADPHGIANMNGTFEVDSVNPVSAVAKFIGVSVISGANQLYNIPASVGNLFGMDNEISKADDVISEMDSDLGAFYKDHKQGADLVGFMLSSLVPGLAGTKILSAGQKSLQAAHAGNVGGNMGRAMGLLVPSRKKKLAAAIKEVANGSAPAKLANAKALQAVTAGVHANVLEAVVFEVAVGATLHDSPILENQDFGDFVTNVVIGGVVFGAAAGAFDVAKISSNLKKASKEWDDVSKPYTFQEGTAQISSPYEAIAMDLDQMRNMPNVPPITDEVVLANLESARRRTMSSLATRVRANVTALSGGDTPVGDTWYALMMNTPVENQMYNYIGLQDLSRVGHTTKEMQNVLHMNKRLKTELIDPVDGMDPELKAFMLDPKYIGYAKTWGDDAGQSYKEAPTFTQLVDTVGKDSDLKVTASGVEVMGQNKYKFQLGNNAAKNASADSAANGDILTMSPLEVNARYIWSRSDEVESFATKLENPNTQIVVHGNDIPMLEKLLREVPDAATNPRVEIIIPDGTFIGPKEKGLKEYLFHQKVALSNELLERNAKLTADFKDMHTLTQEQIAAITNVRTRFLSGHLNDTPVGSYADTDMFAMDTYRAEFAKRIGKRVDEVPDVWKIPQHIRTVYKGEPKKAGGIVGEELDNFITENMTTIKAHQRVYQGDLDRASSMALVGVLGEEARTILGAAPVITTNVVRTSAVSTGIGGGRYSSPNENYGTLANSMQYLGNLVATTIGKAKHNTREAMEPMLYKLGQNQEAAIEWSVLNANMRNQVGEYSLNEAGDALIPTVVKRWQEMSADAVSTGSKPPAAYKLPEIDMPLEIPIKNQEVRDLARMHIERNGTRTTGLVGIREAQGTQMSRSADAFYPIPVNPQDHKFFGIVVDDSVSSGGANRTLYASSAEELESMKRKVEQNPQLRVLTKKDAEDYHKARGEFDYEKTINSAYLNTEIKRAGGSASFIVPTNPQKIVDDTLSWHMQREAGLVREAIGAKYEVQFEELRRLGDEATGIKTSKASDQSLLTFAEESTENPYAGYIKTALAVKDTAKYPLWRDINTYADKAVSALGHKISAAFYTSKGTDDVTAIQGMLERAGYKHGALYDEDMIIFANSTPATGTLSGIVQKANATLATVVLRMDFLNAVNNAVSANVLLGAEMKAIQRAINNGDKEAVGALASLTRINVPGTEQSMLAPTKLIANAIKRFHEEGRDGATMAYYREHGFVTSITDQYRDAIETLSFSGRESLDIWSGRVDKLREGLREAGNKGEIWTGNRLAEEFNRFVAADVMKQMTDVAVSRNLMGVREQLAYINTFVNRTQGNYLASQRPMAFQGAIGQAVGLFQTYQFNLMQQLFRHMGEGHAKDAMTLLALQGSIHGMNGLPAFNAVNTHIIGSASGNKEHRDTYDAVYGIVGKTAGDFLMYGAASSTMGLIHPDLKVNLYTRGDLNPRHITILPTDPGSVPFIQAFSKFAANLVNTSKQLAAGGDVAGTFIRGLEHNGISRPLAGLAQTMEAFNNPQRASYSTSKQGNVIGANDLLSLANLARIAGGKPLDEAIALDATFRFRTYGLKDAMRRDMLGKAIKSTLIAGNNPTGAQIERFAEDYAKAGGRQEEFNNWFGDLYKTANSSQANEIQRSLNSLFTQAMQKIMGGETLDDFSGN